MRRVALLVLIAACGGSPEPAGLLVDLAPGDAPANPTFIASIGQVYILTESGALWRRRGVAEPVLLASPPAEFALVAATDSGVFLADATRTVVFCNEVACTSIGPLTGDGFVANNAYYFPGRQLETPCLMRANGADGEAAACVIPGFVIEEATALGSGALFTGSTADGTAEGVWGWDGVGDPVLLVADNTLPFTRPSGGVFATSADGTAAQIWRTDGTIAGTAQLGEVPINAISSVVVLDDGAGAFVIVDDQPWHVGAAGAVQLPGRAVGYARAGNRLVYSDNLDLRRSDGTIGGTETLRPADQSFVLVEGEEVAYLQHQPILSIGTSGAPVPLDGPLAIGGPPTPVSGGLVYLAGGDVPGAYDVWVAVTAGFERLTGISDARSSSPAAFTRAGDLVYFRAAAAPGGMWRTDGTESGTSSIGGGFEDVTFADAGDGSAWALDGATAYWIPRDEGAQMIASGVTSLAAWGDQAIVTLGTSPALLTSAGGVNGLSAPSPPTAMLAIGDTMYGCSNAGLLSLDRGASSFVVVDAEPCDAVWRVGTLVFARTAQGLRDGGGHLLVAGNVETVDPSGFVFAGGLYRIDGTRIGAGDWTGATPLGRTTGGLVFVHGDHLWATSGDEPRDLGAIGAIDCATVVDNVVWVWSGGQRWVVDGGTMRAVDPIPGFYPPSCAITQLGDRVLYRGHDDATGDELWTAPTE